MLSNLEPNVERGMSNPPNEKNTQGEIIILILSIKNGDQGWLTVYRMAINEPR